MKGENKMNNNYLTDQDLHCIARFIQSVIFKDHMLYGCQYCKYSLVCGELLKVGSRIHYDDIRTKLEEMTGIDLGYANTKNKFLASSFQKLYPERYKKIMEDSQKEVCKEENDIEKIEGEIAKDLKKMCETMKI